MKPYIKDCLMLLLAGCSSVESKRVPASSTEQPPIFPGEVWGPDQDSIAQRMVASSIVTAHRETRPKLNGCVKANWTTADIVNVVGPRAGLFSEPGVQYQAWIRYSDGSAQQATETEAAINDADANLREMAVKLMRVKQTPRGSQDFLLMTSPNFFSKDADDYLDFNDAVRAGKLKLGEYLVMHPRNARILLESRVHSNNPLEPTYFGPLPSRIGDSSMRYKAVPCAALPNLEIDKGDSNFLRTHLVKTLANQSACYDFYVQINRDPVSNPIEDPRKIWSEEQSPFVLAARLTIPQQTVIAAQDQREFCENIRMDSWNTQDELRPLGQINRLRKALALSVSSRRNQRGHAVQAEPSHY